MLRELNGKTPELPPAGTHGATMDPGIYSERGPGNTVFVTIYGRSGEPLAYITLAEGVTGGELPPEFRAWYDRVVGHPMLRRV